MIDSNQVNALMMQQQQQQQMLGMGAPSAVVGQSQYPPQYNFGQSSLMSGSLSSGGAPARYAAGAVSGASSLLGAGAMASTFMPASITGATMGGYAGMALGLNPLTMGLGATAAGVGAIGSSMHNGMQTSSQVGRMLSSSNFANMGAPGGFGFGFQDQSRMANTVMGMGASNPFVNQKDQMQMLDQQLVLS